MVFLQSHGVGTGARRAHLQDLRRPGHRDGARQPLSPGRPTSGASASRPPTSWPAGSASTAHSPLRARAALRYVLQEAEPATATSAIPKRPCVEQTAGADRHRRDEVLPRRRRGMNARPASWCASRGARGAVAVPQAAVPRRAGRRARPAQPAARATIRCRQSTSRRPSAGSRRRWASSWRATQRDAIRAGDDAARCSSSPAAPASARRRIVRGILEIFAARRHARAPCAPRPAGPPSA